MCALKNVREVELMGMAKLKKCVLMGGLKNVESVKMENAGKLESVKGLKDVVEEERKKREEEEAERKKREEEERKRREKEEKERKRKEEEERKKREAAERKKKEEKERKRREEEERKRREEERKKREEMIALAKATVNVRNVEDLKNASISILVIVIASNCCNERELSVLDLSQFMNLRELKVGDECFENVNEVKLIGLSKLERVVIGEKSFTKHKNPYFGYDPSRHFYLKDCERLKELKIGYYSFCDYTVCEIENVPSLEVIEMGELNEESYNFSYASLELKSDSERMK